MRPRMDDAKEYIRKAFEEQKKRWARQDEEWRRRWDREHEVWNRNLELKFNDNFTPWTRKSKNPQNNTQVSQENTPHNHVHMQTEPILPIPATPPHWTPPTPPPAPINPSLQLQPLPSNAQDLPNNPTQAITPLMSIIFTPHTICQIKSHPYQLHTPRYHAPPQPTTLPPIINTLTQLINSYII